MKKVITISIIVLVLLGVGVYLASISGEPVKPAGQEQFDYTGLKQLSEPLPVSAEDHVLGNPEAKNTMIVYEDFQCPGCASFVATLKQAPTELQDTKVIVRHFPLLTIHKNAASSAFAAEAAAAQGKFWEMYDQLYSNQAAWSNLANPTEKYVELARSAGVPDLDRFRNDLTNKTYKPRVQENLLESEGLQLPGTPTIFFNNKYIDLDKTGFSIAGIKQEVEQYYIK